jgi:hypothetical protein
MRFLRHDGIYRSDVSLPLINPAQMPPPVGRLRCQAIGREGRSTPCPSSAMSSGRLFLDRGGRHQSPSPLRRHIQHKSLAFRRASNYHRTAGSVLTVCVSRGDKRRTNPQILLTNRVSKLLARNRQAKARGMREQAHGRTGLPLLPAFVSAFQVPACSGRMQRSGLPTAAPR